jgi:large subunit ribosomal protein L35
MARKIKAKGKVKLKSKRGAAKRFRKTASGYKCKSANRNHILTKKTTKRKRRLRGGVIVRDEDMGRVEQMMPYTK